MQQISQVEILLVINPKYVGSDFRGFDGGSGPVE